MKQVLTDINLDGVARVKNSLDAVDLQDCVTLVQHNTKADKSTTIAGVNGLVGGGDLSASRQIAMQYPDFAFSNSTIQTSTSTTYANINDLTTGVFPVGVYAFKVVAIAQSTATNTGIGFRIGEGSATLSTCVGKWFISQGANGTSQSYQYDQLTKTTNVASASAPAANTDFTVIGFGTFRVTSAGTVAVQIRSESTTAVSVRPDSILQIKRIA